jgi:hypothetical protein
MPIGLPWLGLAILAIALLMRRSVYVRNQALFASGTLPDRPLDGLYRGSVPGLGWVAGWWYGKRFDGATQSGVNLKRSGEQIEDIWPFRIHVGPGLQDPTQQVIRFDYDLEPNPIILRKYYGAELVQVSTDRYLVNAYLWLRSGHPLMRIPIELQAERPASHPGAESPRATVAQY